MVLWYWYSNTTAPNMLSRSVMHLALFPRPVPLFARSVACVALALLVACSAAAAVPITSVRLLSGLARPVFMTVPPGDSNRLFILEQHVGRIRVYKLQSQTLEPTPFLTVSDISTGNEQGLLGLAFHPQYQSNGHFYIYTTEPSWSSRVDRYTVSTNPDIADATSRFEILEFDQPFRNHNAGWMSFGTDGYLYVATGDGGSGNDPSNNAQRTEANLLGKMLRLDVDSDDFPGDSNRNYAIPPDNPFVGTNGLDEIWAYGLRNPWRCSFDRETADLWIADVGQDVWEEINFQPAASTGGENYGWHCKEATHLTGFCTPAPDVVDPIYEYNHSDGISITGGNVYRGSAIPDLTGTYFFADFAFATIWSLRYDGQSVSGFTNRTDELVPDVGSINQIASFGEDASGEMYICDLGGEIFKIVPVPEPAGLTLAVLAGLLIAAHRAGC